MPRRTRRRTIARARAGTRRSADLRILDLPIPVGHPNRGGDALEPFGVVWHRTGGDHGASWLSGYFGRSPRDFNPDTWAYGSAHYGVDDAVIARYIPENEVAWHVAGDTPEQNQNRKRLGVELCQYLDDPPRIRPACYAFAVRLAVDLCARHGWSGPRERAPDGAPRFTRHSDWQRDRATDPGEYLRWKDFLDDVENAIAGTPWVPQEERDMADYRTIEEQVKRTIRAVILNEPQLTTSAILHPDGYGPRLQGVLDQMARGTRGVRGLRGIDLQRALTPDRVTTSGRRRRAAATAGRKPAARRRGR